MVPCDPVIGIWAEPRVVGCRATDFFEERFIRNGRNGHAKDAVRDEP